MGKEGYLFTLATSDNQILACLASCCVSLFLVLIVGRPPEILTNIFKLLVSGGRWVAVMGRGGEL